MAKPEVTRENSMGLARKARLRLRPLGSKYEPLPPVSNQMAWWVLPPLMNSAASTRPAPWFQGTGSPSAVTAS